MTRRACLSRVIRSSGKIRHVLAPTFWWPDGCSTDDFSNENFKWLTAKNVNVGYAPVNAMRVNFVGELGWELHHPIEMQNYLFLTFFIKPYVWALIENCFVCTNWKDCNDNAGFVAGNKVGDVKPYLNQSGKT